MKIATIAAVVLALAAAVTASAFAWAGASGVDRANAARACAALQAKNASAFSMQYARFGACSSQWVKVANRLRVNAERDCHAKGLTGRRYRVCLESETRTALMARVTAAENAAVACAAEETSLGAQAFQSKYGTNLTLRDAFGKCVSERASGKLPPKPVTVTRHIQHFTVSLAPLNGSNVSGTGSLLLSNDRLQVRLMLRGLERGEPHPIAIYGLSTGAASCPTAAADSDHNGLISLAEAQPLVGNVLLSLDPLTLSKAGSSTLISSSLLPLQTRTILVQGMTVNGSYDATLPVACGTITIK